MLEAKSAEPKDAMSHIINQVQLRRAPQEHGEAQKIWNDLANYNDYLDYKQSDITQKQVLRYIIENQLKEPLPLGARIELEDKLHGKFAKGPEDHLIGSHKLSSN